MQLCVDIGNTRTKLGIFEGKTLLGTLIWADWSPEAALQLCHDRGIRRAIVSSVSAPVAPFIDAGSGRISVVALTHLTPLPFQNAYTTPETLGKDRLAAVAGAHALYGGLACLVIDCGTCIKYEMLRADGVYLGGNIAPGAQMRQKAMHHFTARLPEVEMRMPDLMVGNSTLTALQNGAFRGACLEMQGFIELFEAAYGPIKIILTGGDAQFFKSNLSVGTVEYVPDLTLIGLNHILSCA